MSLSSSDSEEFVSKKVVEMYIEVEHADEVARKLNDLVQRGVIPKDRILYKYLNDVLEIFYDASHEYDPAVVEFCNSIAYCGGRRTMNLLRGPMNIGSDQPDSLPKMNFGGPSRRTRDKFQAGYTVEPGVIKPLSLASYSMCNNSTSRYFVKLMFAC